MANKKNTNKNKPVAPKPHLIEVDGTLRVAQRVMVIGHTGKRRFEWHVK